MSEEIYTEEQRKRMDGRENWLINLRAVSTPGLNSIIILRSLRFSV
jgi:hypothetical protein